jgi:hypothetical protein
MSVLGGSDAALVGPAMPTVPQRSRWRRRLLLFIAMLLSGGLLIFPRIPLLLLLMVLCIAQRGYRFTLDRRMIGIAVLLAAILMLSLLRPGNFDPVSIGVRFANFVAGLMLLRVYLESPAGALFEDLQAILKWMAVQALLTVLLAVAAQPLFMVVDVNETLYHTLGWIFTHHETLTGADLLPRPDGFFYEPGVFQIYLNIYLYIALFVTRRWGHAVLALAAVVATQSTTGVAIALLLIGGLVLQSLQRGSLSVRALRVVGLLVLLAPMAWVAQENISNKLVGEARGSAWARQYDLLTGLNVIAANPVWGIGFEHERYLTESASLGFADTLLDERLTERRGNTNGIIFMLYSLGVPFALPFIFGMFRQRFFAHRLLFGTLLFASFLSESIVFTPFFLMLIFSGLLTTSVAERSPGKRSSR